MSGRLAWVSVVCLAIALLAGGMFLHGCTRPAKQSKQITLTYLFPGNSTERKIVESYMAEFERAHPDIRVDLILSEARAKDKLTMMIAAGCPPDVMYIESDAFAKYAESGVLLNLDPYLERDGADLEEDIFPAVLDFYRYKGHLYGIPRAVSPVVLFYNRDLFDESGVSYPDATWNWDTMLQAAKKLTRDRDGDGRTDQFGLGISSWTRMWPMFVWQNGGEIFNSRGTKCVIDSPEAVYALQWWADLHAKHGVMPNQRQLKDQSAGDMFIAQRIAMFIDIAYMTTDFRSKITGFRWDVAPLPCGKTRRCLLFSSCFAASSRTKHPEEAWELLRFLGSPSTQTYIAQSGHDVPVLKSVAYSSRFLNPALPPAHGEEFLNSLEHARFSPFSRYPFGTEMQDAANGELEYLFLGQRDARDACHLAARKVNGYLNGKPRPVALDPETR